MYNIATRGLFKGMNPRVTAASTLVIAAFAGAGAIFPDRFAQASAPEEEQP